MSITKLFKEVFFAILALPLIAGPLNVRISFQQRKKGN